MATASRYVSNVQIHAGPTMNFTGTVSITRNSESDASVTVSVSGNVYMPYGGSYGEAYSGHGLSASFNSTDNSQIHGNVENVYNGKPFNVSFSTSWTSGNGKVYINCRFGSKGSSALYCDKGWADTLLASIPISELPYNPYRQPTIGCSTSYIISRYDTRREMWIDGNASGDNTDTDTWVIVNGNRENWDIGNSGGTYGFYPNQKGVSDGSSYSFQAYRQHTRRRDWTASTSITLYTYRTPLISSFSLNNLNFSGTGNTTLTWQTNAKRWNNYIGNYTGEKNFITYLKFNTDNVWFQSSNNNPTQSENNALVNETQTLNKTIIDKHFSVAQRSQDKVDTVISIKRNNPSSGVDSTVLQQNISVQFRPKYRPDNDTNINNPPVSLIYRENNSTGNSISAGSNVYVDDVPNVYVQWTYPSNADGGVIDGYIIRIYEDKAKTKLFKTFEVNTSNLTASRIFDITKELKRGILNYISITAFYNKPDNSGKAEGPALDYPFILPLGRLHKPVISYPINNTQWHNPNFRILFELPEDTDYDTYDDDILNNYNYRNIEVRINNNFIFAFKANTENMTSSAIIEDKAFSTSDLSYKLRICINPSLVTGFPITTLYSMQVRVQKNYYQPVWSEWSDLVNLSQSSISFSVNKGDLILADHFNRMRNWSIRLYNVYPINSLSNGNITVNIDDIIYKDIYDVVYNTVLGIQTGVNNWAVFDANRSNVKFNQNIYELSGDNKVKVEVITALPNNASENGRNYIKLIVDCMNKLY